MKSKEITVPKPNPIGTWSYLSLSSTGIDKYRILSINPLEVGKWLFWRVRPTINDIAILWINTAGSDLTVETITSNYNVIVNYH